LRSVNRSAAAALRQQHLHLDTNQRLHNQIEATQAQLWNQQLSIASAPRPTLTAAAGAGSQTHRRTTDCEISQSRHFMLPRAAGPMNYRTARQIPCPTFRHAAHWSSTASSAVRCVDRRVVYLQTLGERKRRSRPAPTASEPVAPARVEIFTIAWLLLAEPFKTTSCSHPIHAGPISRMTGAASYMDSWQAGHRVGSIRLARALLATAQNAVS